VQADPGRFDDLRRHGINLVPAVILGDRAVQGWNPRGYAELLDVAFDEPARLSPRALATRLDEVLAAAQTSVSAMTREHLDWVPSERKRTVRDLAYHVFRLSLAYIDAMDRGALPEGWLQETAPDGFDDGPAVARYGALVRGRLAGWFQGAGDDEFSRVIDVYYGPETGHSLLERTTWHAAQHVRQLEDCVRRLGVDAPAPSPALYTGLPLPAALW
jgi:DinB family protein